MDPITVAIVAALPSLASETLKDAYEGLKAIIRRKWGDMAPISTAISAVEESPGSNAKAVALDETIKAVGAGEDSEVSHALKVLIEQVKLHGDRDAAAGVQFTMSGGLVQGVAGAQNVTIGSMNFAQPSKT